jgi:hypothetical protein
VVSLVDNPPEHPPVPYRIQCSLEFDTVAQVQESLKASGEKIMADVANFSSEHALLMVGDEVVRTDI